MEAAKTFSAFTRQQKHPWLVGYLCTTWSKVKTAEAAQWPPIVEVLSEWRH